MSLITQHVVNNSKIAYGTSPVSSPLWKNTSHPSVKTTPDAYNTLITCFAICPYDTSLLLMLRMLAHKESLETARRIESVTLFTMKMLNPKRVFKLLSAPKIGSGLMIAVAAYQLFTAINALIDEDKRVGFRID